MSMQVFAHDGNCVIEGIWSAMTSAKSFDTLLLTLPWGGGQGQDATHFVRYTAGATAALAPGETLEGGSSGSTCILVAQAVEVGTAGSSDTGILFLKSPSAAFEAETLTGGTSTGTVAIIQDLIALPKYAKHPKALLYTVETAGVNRTISGITPTVSAGTNHGHTISSGQSEVIRGMTNIRNFKVINAIASSGAILKYSLYY